MNDIAVLGPDALPTPYELGGMSTQQLREKLALSLTMTAKHLVFLATIWGELEKRGEDLSDLRMGMAVYLPQIAAGRLDADAVIRFAGQPTVLKSIAMLPVAEQREIAHGKPVSVLTVNAQGEYENAELPAYTLTAAQARMVFGGDKLRTPKEQQALFESVKLAKSKRVVPGPQNKVRYDAKADVLRIGRSSATVGEVVGALTLDAIPPDDSVADLEPVVFKLPPSAKRVLKVRAAEAGVSVEKLVAGLVYKFGKLGD